MGGYNTCIYFGIMLASATMGLVIERSGYLAAFVLAAAVTGLFLAVFGLLMRTYKA
jgi:predicted MFS family arabinose efflux permease